MRSVRDNLGRVKTATYTGGRTLTYSYTGDGQLYSVHDSQTDLLYQYTYDSLGRLITSAVINAEDSYDLQRLLSTRQTYDANNQLSAQYWQIGDTNCSETYTYSKTTGLLATHKPAVGNTLSYGYDELQRLFAVPGVLSRRTNLQALCADYNTVFYLKPRCPAWDSVVFYEAEINFL